MLYSHPTTIHNLTLTVSTSDFTFDRPWATVDSSTGSTGNHERYLEPQLWAAHRPHPAGLRRLVGIAGCLAYRAALDERCLGRFRPAYRGRVSLCHVGIGSTRHDRGGNPLVYRGLDASPDGTCPTNLGRLQAPSQPSGFRHDRRAALSLLPILRQHDRLAGDCVRGPPLGKRLYEFRRFHRTLHQRSDRSFLGHLPKQLT